MSEIIPENTESTLKGDPGTQLPPWVGLVFGLAILATIVGLGGLYLWGSLLSPEDLAPQAVPVRINDEPETVRATADIQATETLSPSSEVSAIEADVESTLFDTYELDLQAMDAEIGEFERRISAP